jgi:hypothetical protein
LIDAGLRPMSTSQVLDRTFYLYRKNFLLFAGIALVGPALSLIASVIQFAAFGVPVMPRPDQFNPTLLQKLVIQLVVEAILGLVFYTVGQALATGATMHAVSMVHLGKPTTILDSYRTITPVFWRILRILFSIYLRMLWPIFATYVLLLVLAFGMIASMRKGGSPGVAAALLILASSLFLIAALFGGVVWAFYVYCRYSLAVPACTLERLTAKESMARSRFLVQGSMWRIVAIYMLLLVMIWILTSVLQIPAYLSGNIFSLKPGAQITAGFVFWATLGGFLGRILAGPIATIAIALVYYDQRVRKEAFDLQLMMDALVPPPPMANPAVPGVG